ncbi:Ger(x)C family spore germination protein [Oceanobacillus saliphilus]|uniref:Ger(x)C family spore germination protein n=1 Tax=Oceanobacillus saliphilus TaxID=2925834 RepID=UPI00201D3D2F|nr:Ger(x)C family spore germination protein [Oceanobacillus saliphilus]
MKSKKILLICIYAFLSVVLSACWDAIEVEDKGFLSGVAIDLAEEQGENMTFEMTLQFVVPGGLGTATEAGGGKAFRNLSQTGESLYEINADIARQENRSTNTEHLKLILISTDIVEQEELFGNVINVFLRQSDMRRGMLLGIVDGKAKDLLEVEPEHVKIPAQYISELMENPRNTETIEQVRVGEIQEHLLANASFKIPQLAFFSDDRVNYEGVSIFEGDKTKMVGTLTGGEVKGLNFIIGKDQLGNIVADIEGEKAEFVILKGGSKIKLTNKNKENLKFQVDIDVETQLSQYEGTLDFYKQENLEKFEKSIEDAIKKMSEDALKKVKDELQADVLTFGNHLRMHHYELWEEIKDDWDHGKNYFSKSDATFNVEAIVREPGNTIKIQTKGDK